MSDKNNIKQQICSQLFEEIEQRITAIEKTLHSLEESRNNETKSSAGDKYETGREMIQIEFDNNKTQLAKTTKLKNELNLLNLEKAYSSIERGSLAITNQGNYFFSIGLGTKIDIEGEAYFIISLASPIGKALINKQKGDTVQFMEKGFEVLEVL